MGDDERPQALESNNGVLQVAVQMVYSVLVVMHASSAAAVVPAPGSILR